MKYSFLSLVRNGLSYHENWGRQWRSPSPKREYEVVVVGAGGHGLATAYYLAKEHGITNVAVLEKGWLGGGSVGRNTTIVRSNYLWDETSHLYEMSLKLWENLSQELNYNVMLSQRGVINLAHSLGDMRGISRRVHSNRLNGIDAEILTTRELKALVPILNTSPKARYPVLGASLQRRGGTARHDAVAWGFARAADVRGVDIIQECGVTGIRRESGQVVGVETTKGFIKTKKVGVVVAGNSSVLAEMAGVRLPIQSHPLQALVSDPLKSILHAVVMSNAVHAYISQTDKGELVLGAGIDAYNGYGLRGSLHVDRAQSGRNRRVVSDIQSGSHDAAMGGDGGHLSRCQSDHQQDSSPGPLFQLWVGYGRFQSDTGLGLRIRPYHRSGPAPSSQ